MNIIKTLVVVGLLAISSFSVADTIKDKLITYSNNVVKITKDISGGSGTFISPSYVLTNHHVVNIGDGEAVYKQVKVHTPDGVTRVGIITAHSQKMDLALVLVVNYKHDSYATIATAAPEKLSKTWSLGYPSLIPLVITAGTYQYNFTNGAGSVCEVTTAPIFPGNSGGSTVTLEGGELKMLGVPTSVVVSMWSGYPHGACSTSYTQVRKFLRANNPNLALEIDL